MRIVIDMQGAQTESRFRGIGRYTLSLVKALLQNRGDHEVILVLNGLFPDTILPIRTEFDGLLPQNSIRVWEASGPICEWNPDNTWRRKVAELIWAEFLNALDPDFILLTSLFEGYGDDFAATVIDIGSSTPIAIIFYDLIPLIYRENYLADPYISAWYDKKVSQLKAAQLLLSISEASKHEAIELLNFPKNRIVNISTASEKIFKPIDISNLQNDAITHFGLRKPFLMYASATDLRKNHLRLIDAYSRVPHQIRTNHQLALVGVRKPEHKSNFEKFAKKVGLADGELVIISYVTDNEMNLLYNLCKAFVFPSWHEGFGLPALEAMQCGRAVIGSNRSSVPEVIGRADALFDPFSEHSIAQKIEEVLNNNVFRSELERHSLEQSKKFSWDASAINAISAMESYVDAAVPLPNNAILPNSPAEIIARLVERIRALPFHHTDNDLRSSAIAIGQNFQNTDIRQLLVDISELVQHNSTTKIQTAVRCILREWLSSQPEGMQVEAVYASKNQPYRYARRFVREFLNCPDANQDDEIADFNSGDYFIGLDLVDPEIAISHQDFYQHLRQHNVLVKFVVHDMFPIGLTQNENSEAQAKYNRWIEVVAQSDGAICISKSVASELSDWLSLNEKETSRQFRINWFHLRSDIEHSLHIQSLPDDAGPVLCEIMSRLTFLSVSALEPLNSQTQTVAAFEQLWNEKQDINLVLLGKQGWLTEAQADELRSHPELNKRLFLLDGISDEYLSIIYAASTCFIAASYGEKFGLSLIEAAQNKLPIIARDIPVFREVAGPHAFYFSGESPSDLARAILDWVPRHAFGHAPKFEIMPWLTWKHSADQLMQCIKDGMRSYN